MIGGSIAAAGRAVKWIPIASQPIFFSDIIQNIDKYATS
jgi:hypothetical protein